MYSKCWRMALEQIERKLYVRWNGRSILHFFQKSSTAEEGTYLYGISIVHICSHVVAMLGLPHVPKTRAAAFLWFPGRDVNVQWWVKL